VNIPSVETQRLRLRPFRASDLEAWSELCADPEVMRFLGGRPLEREEAWRKMAEYIGHWELRGFGQWAIAERESDRLLGRSGLLYPEGWPGIEVAWVLSRDAWGRGYASEAGRATIDWAFGTLELATVISLIDPLNEASKRVARAVGERHEGQVEVHGETVEVWRIDRPG